MTCRLMLGLIIAWRPKIGPHAKALLACVWLVGGGVAGVSTCRTGLPQLLFACKGLRLACNMWGNGGVCVC